MEDININGVWVSPDVLTTYFQCDYNSCKGACCSVNLPNVELFGGALSEKEAQELRGKRKTLVGMLPTKERRKIVGRDSVDVEDGEYFTPLDRKGECVYCLSHGCLFKDTDKVSFDVPVSCGLYPLCIDRNPTRLYLDDMFGEYCKPSYELGRRNNIKVYQWCKKYIVKALGEEFYNNLEKMDKYEAINKAGNEQNLA